MGFKRKHIADELAKSLVRSQAEIVAAAITKGAMDRAGIVGDRPAKRRRAKRTVKHG